MEEKITITKSDIQKDTIGHSKWLKHKESRFNSLFPKRLEKVYSTIRSLSKLSNRNNYYYEKSNIFTALSSIVFELRELAASYGLDSQDIKYPLAGQQTEPTLTRADAKNNDAKEEVIGEVVNAANGEILEEVTAPESGRLFTIRKHPLVYPGAPLARIARKDLD